MTSLKKYKDSPLSISIQVGIDISVECFYFIGFDGYDLEINNDKYKLTKENQEIFNCLFGKSKYKIFSLAPTQYSGLELSSIFGLIN